jgi:hypothetical protein
MYPQPQSSISVQRSQDVFRLLTELQSNGDIYEIDTSVLGLVIGPNSDIQNVRAYFFDDQSSDRITTALISVSDPYLGRVDARMNEDYPAMDLKGHVLIVADDLVPHPDQVFLLGQSTGPLAGENIVWHRPQLDLIAHHTTPKTSPIARAERQWVDDVWITSDLAQEGDGNAWYLYPHYRRKYFHVRTHLVAIPDDMTYDVYGITFFPDTEGNFDGYPSMVFRPIVVGAALTGVANAPSDSGPYTVLYSNLLADQIPANATANSLGYFDYMLVRITDPATPAGGWDPAAFPAGIPGSTVLSLDVISTDWAD